MVFSETAMDPTNQPAQGVPTVPKGIKGKKGAQKFSSVGLLTTKACGITKGDTQKMQKIKVCSKQGTKASAIPQTINKKNDQTSRLKEPQRFRKMGGKMKP